MRARRTSLYPAFYRAVGGSGWLWSRRSTMASFVYSALLIEFAHWLVKFLIWLLYFSRPKALMVLALAYWS